VEPESGLLPAPAGSAALSVSWRARSRQIRDHHRAQRRGSSRRYKRRLTLLQEGVSWLHSLLCSAPLPALDVVTQQGWGLSEIAFIHALLRQSMTPLRSPLPRSVSGGRSILHEQTIIGFAQIYGGQRKSVAADRLADRVGDQLLIMQEPVWVVPHMGVLGAVTPTESRSPRQVRIAKALTACACGQRSIGWPAPASRGFSSASAIPSSMRRCCSRKSRSTIRH
jgi:hypothetical protein